MRESALNHDIDLGRVQRSATDLPLLKSIPGQLQTLQFCAEPGQREPHIDQSTEHHVAAHTRETIEMQPSSHSRSLSTRREKFAHLTQGALQRQSVPVFH
jgi:hypothetical protein